MVEQDESNCAGHRVRPWDAVDAIVASVGPWWIPEPTEAPE